MGHLDAFIFEFLREFPVQLEGPNFRVIVLVNANFA